MGAYAQKIELVRALLKQKKLDGILFMEQKNVSWLTSGRSFVNMASDKAIAYLLVTVSEIVLIANNIENGRLLSEEMDGSVDRVEVYPWYEPERRQKLIQQFSDELHIVTDAALEEDLLQVRTIVTPEETDAVRRLGRDTAEAIEQAAFEFHFGETEFEIASRMAANCWRRGVEPIVALVAADERAFRWRHPLPTGKASVNYAMLVICGRRGGRVVSATRLVHRGQLNQELQQKHRAVATVDASIIANTVAGRSFSDLMILHKQAYADAGYPDEWKLHHQGGLAGFQSREQLLLPGEKMTVKTGQMYAWNPSIAGTKSEDTILVQATANEIITHTGNFPTMSIQCQNQVIARPDILQR